MAFITADEINTELDRTYDLVMIARVAEETGVEVPKAQVYKDMGTGMWVLAIGDRRWESKTWRSIIDTLKWVREAK